MIEIEHLTVDKRHLLGVKIELPDSPPLVAVIAEKGFIMCRFLDLDVAEKLGAAAATVSGVNTFSDVLDAKVDKATSNAESRGVKAGMRAREAVRML